MKRIIINLAILIYLLSLAACGANTDKVETQKNVRPLRDTVGFAQYAWQMDSLMARMDRTGWSEPTGEPWKMAICPHDDYTYVGRLYPEVLSNIKADRIIIIGVAHRAAALGIEDKLVFDSHTHWKGPWKDVKVSDYREDLLDLLKDDYAMVSDTLQCVEHSLESLIPFLQYFNRNIEIVPILVPTMNPDRMEELGKSLAGAISQIAENKGWIWGEDYAIVVTTDAVHYGTDDWNGNNNARFGCDDEGNQKARDYEDEIISETLSGVIEVEKVRKFSDYTLSEEDYRTYIWTWCGRYCIPTTLYTTYYLNDGKDISGELIGYYTSITTDHIPVDDLVLGRTAIATNCHWVGYAALGYR
jgi:AmmeMemoRadiSam system protein B